MLRTKINANDVLDTEGAKLSTELVTRQLFARGRRTKLGGNIA
jgi:hypothetical protein